jgi:ABC-2 type transport system ATP-binding protein
VAVIETRGLRKSFQDFKTRGALIEAVRGVDLAVMPGEIFGFLGPNGAGKSTTMRMLTTLLTPSGGEATVAGYDLLRQPHLVRQRIGYVSQAGGADEAASGLSNLVLQGRLFGMSKREAQERATELLHALELDHCLHRPVSGYSGGQRRRLDLAMGMVHRPTLLFLDEPTTGLDPQSRAWLWDEVRHLRDRGTTVFVTTHYLEEADALCDQLAIIDEGRIVAEGTPETLKREIASDIIMLGLQAPHNEFQRAETLLHQQAYVRELHSIPGGFRLYVDRGDQVLPLLLRELDAAGFLVRSLELARPTLEDVFLKQTGRSLREALGGAL